ncbi:hypothetical protein GA0070624_3735 [Micromonospora rhizosphaerae]|uniref:Uncharacterized protein n=1 Tax=Micromonospora rhizosphaerae TaxID=568872 RepID=A0A1C6SGW4_9ACTN|nr:hypothetical protein GA0070624_3735 [Micromonospora rhizosphaerae]
MRLKRWSVAGLVAVLDRVIVFPESTGWPCPRDGDHDDFRRVRMTQAPEADSPQAATTRP